MNLGKADYAALIIIAGMFVVTGYGFTELSGEIAIHFDTSGEPDDYMAVIPGLLMLPVIGIGILLLFQYLPKIDPLGENYASFADLFELLKVLLVGIIAYLQTAIIIWNLGYTYNPVYILVPVIFSAYVLAGQIMQKAEQNWFIGIRTPWTLSSDQVWKETHETMAPLMKLAGALSLLVFVFPEYGVLFFAVPAAAVALFATIYSYWLYRKQE